MTLQFKHYPNYTYILLFKLITSSLATEISKQSANSFLQKKRNPRANTGFFDEILKKANYNRECVDNLCTTEEFNEVVVFKTTIGEWDKTEAILKQQALFDPCGLGYYVENGVNIHYSHSSVKIKSGCYERSLKSCNNALENGKIKAICHLYQGWQFCGDWDEKGLCRVCDEHEYYELTKSCEDFLKLDGKITAYNVGNFTTKLAVLNSVNFKECRTEMLANDKFATCVSGINEGEYTLLIISCGILMLCSIIFGAWRCFKRNTSGHKPGEETDNDNLS